MANETVDAAFVEAHLLDMPLVDVRVAELRDVGWIPGSLHAPYEDIILLPGDPDENFEIAIRELGLGPEDDLILYCRSGHKARAATESLVRRGYSNIHTYAASFNDWMSDPARPVEKA